jgi:murein DD-endopeptidase MepM/ murein hydrolase activator NlpD
MRILRFRYVGLAVLSAMVASPWALWAQGAQLPPPLELRVPKPPTVATGENGSFIAYELHVTNLGMQAVTLKSVEVLTANPGGPVLFTLADSALARSIARPGVQVPATERTRIAGGLRAVVYLWVPVDARSAPQSLRNRVRVEQGPPDSLRVQELEGPAVLVTGEPVVISPPLRGGPWLAGNGPSATSGHRRALVSTGGSPTIAQRFAIDYVKVDDKFATHQGDPLKNENYYAEGNDALAVADGRVVEVKDGIPENIPGANSRAVPITLETVGGNHVIIDIGNGNYAFYAHMKPGSIRVRDGDEVKRGQVLGLVGNSGNSTEPHLHFHISDGNSPLGSEGIPYQFREFELVGRCRSFGVECRLETATRRQREIPLENAIVRFTDGR